MGYFGSIIGGHGRWEERREREEISFLKVWKRRGCEGKTSSSIHLLVFLPSSIFHNVLPSEHIYSFSSVSWWHSESEERCQFLSFKLSHLFTFALQPQFIAHHHFENVLRVREKNSKRKCQEKYELYEGNLKRIEGSPAWEKPRMSKEESSFSRFSQTDIQSK